MKRFFVTILCFLFFSSLNAQLSIYVNPLTKDSVISTSFDTLGFAFDQNGKPFIVDKVVAVRNVHTKKSSYWLFFYFLPTDVERNTSIRIQRGKYAYFGTANGTYLRIPYAGKSFTYQYPQMAGFFVNISNYVEELKNIKLQFIRLETSQLYHEINLSEAGENKIANLLQTLLSSND